MNAKPTYCIFDNKRNVIVSGTVKFDPIPTRLKNLIELAKSLNNLYGIEKYSVENVTADNFSKTIYPILNNQ